MKKFLTLAFGLSLGFLASCATENEPILPKNGDTPAVEPNKEELKNPLYKGALLLNEGNFGTSIGGSLDVISEDGKDYTDNIFEATNGHKLGKTTQDLFVEDNRVYVISQKGEDFLTILNLQDYKEIKSYKKAVLPRLKTPHNVAVLNKLVYILDIGAYDANWQLQGGAIYTLDTKNIHQDGGFKKVEGSENVAKGRMVVLNGKVYALDKQGAVLEIEGNKVITTKSFDLPIVEMSKSYDGHIWMLASKDKGAIINYDPKSDAEVRHELKTKEVDGLSTGKWGAPAIHFSATQDTIYFANGPKIYRHIFKAEKNELFVDVLSKEENAIMLYNGLAVDPSNGYVYFSSIKGYPEYKTNNTVIFSKDKELISNHKNLSEFPAGIYPLAKFQN